MAGMIRTSRLHRQSLGLPPLSEALGTPESSGGVTNITTTSSPFEFPASSGSTAVLNVGLTDDTAFTIATDEVLPVGFLADDAATDSVDEGDIGAARMSLARVVRTTPGNDSGTPVTYGAGAVAATTPRTTLASDDPAVVALQIMDDWDESDRAKVNVIVGQAGLTGGAGAVAANTPRMTLASDDPAVAQLLLIAASLSVVDDWDEANRAAVNLISGQVGVTGGAGAVAANTQRVTLASDDPAVVSLGVLDDWDETNRAAVNLIAGQVAITAGAGAVAANTPRATLASDDPAVASLGVMDDWDESDRAKVNPIVGSAGVQGDIGVVSANTQRVVHAGGLVTLQASQVSGTTDATTTRTTTTGLAGYRDIAILINITNAGAVTGTLQLFLQDSWDGGTTWDDLVASNTFTFGAAVTTQRFAVSGQIATTMTQGTAVSVEALAAGTVRNGPWGDRIRVREKVSGTGGAPTGVTYTITAIFK